MHSLELRADAVLVVVDVQRGFDNGGHWGRRDNPDCERNIAALLAAWHDSGRPVVLVRHDSVEANSPLRPDRPGNAFKDVVAGTPHELLVTKSVHSSFLGTPDLHGWLSNRRTRQIVICGIQTNVCCETTARMGCDLGYEVLFVLDATHTFDSTGPAGTTLAAEELARATSVSLQDEFAQVVLTSQVVEAAGRPVPTLSH